MWGVGLIIPHPQVTWWHHLHSWASKNCPVPEKNRKKIYIYALYAFHMGCGYLYTLYVGHLMSQVGEVEASWGLFHTGVPLQDLRGPCIR